MAASAFLLIASFLLVLLLLARPLGGFMARLIEGEPLPALRGVEAGVWRACGIRVTEMNWWQYALAILAFNLLGLALLFALLMTQGSLPLNPQGFPGLSWDLALNTAVSFVTNTNWQAYSGESALSYLSQMAGLAVQNFVSAATGIAVAFALIRAFTRRAGKTVGNAWADLFRITLYVLLPIALLIALFFVSQGTLQNFLPYLHVTTLEGAQQTLPMGPVASQEAIKMLGTNGGGFFGANSAHPFENPTVLTNFVQMLAIFLIPCALCFSFGQLAGENRQGHALIWAMALIFVAVKFPACKTQRSHQGAGKPLMQSLKILLALPRFRLGVLSQFLYVGAQVGLWSFTIRFVQMIEQGATEHSATYWLLATLVCYSAGKVVTTALMKKFSPARLLGVFCSVCVLLLLLAVNIQSLLAVVAIMGVNFCMALCWPTNFGLTIKGLGEETQVAGSIVVMSIIGGAVVPLLMGIISDLNGGDMQIAFAVPLVCFAYVAFYGFYCARKGI